MWTGLSLLLWGCLPKQTLVHDGLEREYITYVPDELPDDAPLVLFLHGYRGTARAFSWLGMKRQADAHGFVVVFPQGTPDRKGATHWNAQLGISDTDDIGFLTELARALQAEHGLDPGRTYTSGISNGGFMSYALICQRPDVFAAAGSIIGTMSGETWATCPATPAPIFQVSGAADTVVPIDGSMAHEGWRGAPAMEEIIARRVEINGCASSSPIDRIEDRRTTATRYTGCTDGAEVHYYVVDGMGHWLPRWAWQAELTEFLLAH